MVSVLLVRLPDLYIKIMALLKLASYISRMVVPLGIRPDPLQVGQAEPRFSDLKSKTEGFQLALAPWTLGPGVLTVCSSCR